MYIPYCISNAGDSPEYGKQYLRDIIMGGGLSASDPHPANETASQGPNQVGEVSYRAGLGEMLAGPMSAVHWLYHLPKQRILWRSDVNVRLDEARGQRARVATPVSPPHSTQFALMAQAIYETVQPPQVHLQPGLLCTGCSYAVNQTHQGP